MLKIRRPLGRLIFNMGIAIPGKTVFLIETAPRTTIFEGQNWPQVKIFFLHHKNIFCKFQWIFNENTQVKKKLRWLAVAASLAAGHMAIYLPYGDTYLDQNWFSYCLGAVRHYDDYQKNMVTNHWWGLVTFKWRQCQRKYSRCLSLTLIWILLI